MQLYLSHKLAAIHDDELRRHAETQRKASAASRVRPHSVIVPKTRPRALVRAVRLAFASL